MGAKILITVMLMVASFAAGYATHFDSPQTVVPQAPAAEEHHSPSNWIDQSNIHLYQDKVVIDIADPQWAVFADTNSMDPVFDQGAHALQVVPGNESQLKVGDIISFTHPGFDGIIIHRIVDIGSDEQGWYAITKGDNNASPDAGKVRFASIHRVLVGILY